MSEHLTRFVQVRWLLCASWIALALLTFSFIDTPSPRTWIILLTGMLIPPAILLRLWGDGPEPTVAEILRATEDRR